MTTALTIPDRYAPILDLLADHHERRGHAGPAKHCMAPECWDVLVLLAKPDEAWCFRCNRNAVCPTCDSIAEFCDGTCGATEDAEAQHEALARALKSMKVQIHDTLAEFAEEYA